MMGDGGAPYRRARNWVKRRWLPFPSGVAHDPDMRALLASNDPVRLSFLAALLADAGIEAVLLDQHASIMDGSIGAIPRRLVVATDEYDRARRILVDAGEL
jgi:hypothetical protein